MIVSSYLRRVRWHALLAFTLLLGVMVSAGCGGGGGGGGGAVQAPAGVSTGDSSDSDDGGGTPPALGVTNSGGSFRHSTAGLELMGNLFLEEAEEGATVHTVNLDGSSARGASDLLLRITLRDGRVIYTDVDLNRADAQAAQLGPVGTPTPSADSGPGWIWVTPVSHLVASYRMQHPDVDLVEAIRRVKRYLGIAATASINRPYASSHRSRFSPRRFKRAADAAGGWATFSSTLVAEIHAGSRRSFEEKLSDALAIRTRGRTGTRQFGIGLLVGAAIGVAKASAQTLFTWVFAKTGWFTTPTQLLSQIEDELGQMQDDMTVLQQDLQQLGTLTLATSLNEITAELESFMERERLTVHAALTSGTQTSTPQNPPSYLSSVLGLLSISEAQRYARQIIAACVGLSGQGNLIAGYNQALAKQWGSSTHAGFNFYEMRNDLRTTQLDNMVSYWEGVICQAFNLLGESTHVVMSSTTNTSPPADLLNQAISVMTGGGLPQVVGGNVSQNGYLALMKRIAQQSPGGLLGGDSALSATGVWALNSSGESYLGTGPANGTLYAAAGVEIKMSGSQYNGQATISATVNNFSVGSIYGWFYPTVSDLQTLCQTHAKQAAAADGVTDGTAIPYGLHKMGLLSDSYYVQGMTNVKIYCLKDDTKPLASSTQWGLKLYSTTDNSSGGTGDSTPNGGKLSDAFFLQQGSSTSDTSIVILVRPFPGEPVGLPKTWTNMKSADRGDSIPSYITNSTTFKNVDAKASPWTWVNESDFALAGGFAPQEIVIAVDGNDSHQLHAYGLWEVDLKNPDMTAYPNAGGLTDGCYVMYCDLTDRVEWLSSDTSAAEVTNFKVDTSDLDSTSNDRGSCGYLLVHDATKAFTVTASWQKQPTTTSATNSAASTAAFVKGTMSFAANRLTAQTTVRDLILSPQNFLVPVPSIGTTVPFFLTGVRDDNRFVDETSDCTWQLFLADGTTPAPSSLAEFDTFFPGLLKFKPGGLTSTQTLVVKATVSGLTAQTTKIQAIAP